MDKDEIFVEIKLRIGESKYGDEAEAVSVQAYEGDELDRNKFLEDEEEDEWVMRERALGWQCNKNKTL